MSIMQEKKKKKKKHNKGEVSIRREDFWPEVLRTSFKTEKTYKTEPKEWGGLNMQQVGLGGGEWSFQTQRT